MPTSATGRSIAELRRGVVRARPAARERGFTLLEVMGALLIAAVLAGTLVLAIPDRSRSLRFEADRLAQLMAVAREEALLRGAPVRLQADGDGFRFVVWLDQAWRGLPDDPALRPRQWLAPTALELERADGQRVIEFGRELVDVPFRLRLSRDGMKSTIRADGLGRLSSE
ncbi:MAG: GspH/FimT family pseudopilin [Betaproteobacteria bacterium]